VADLLTGAGRRSGLLQRLEEAGSALVVSLDASRTCVVTPLSPSCLNGIAGQRAGRNCPRARCRRGWYAEHGDRRGGPARSRPREKTGGWPPACCRKNWAALAGRSGGACNECFARFPAAKIAADPNWRPGAGDQLAQGSWKRPNVYWRSPAGDGFRSRRPAWARAGGNRLGAEQPCPSERGYHGRGGGGAAAAGHEVSAALDQARTTSAGTCGRWR